MEDGSEEQIKKIIRAHVIKFLIIGNVLKKYPYSRGKAQMRHLKVVDAVAKEARIMFGHPKKRKGYKDVAMIKVHSITSGKRTSALKRQKAAKSAHCFSIVETSRTLDLECDSKEDRDMWVAALRFLLLEDHIRQATTIKNASASSLIPPDEVQINCIIGHIAQHHPLVPSGDATILPSATPTTIPEESTLVEAPTLEKPLKEKSKSSASTRDDQPSPSPKSTKTSSKPSSRSHTPGAGDDNEKEKRPSSRSSKKKSLKSHERPAYFDDDGEEPPGKEKEKEKKKKEKKGPRPPKEPRPTSVKPITSPKIDIDAIEAGGDAAPAWLTSSKNKRDAPVDGAPAWLKGTKKAGNKRGSDDSRAAQRATTPKAKSSRKEKKSLRREQSEVIKRKPKREKSEKSLKRHHSSTLTRESTKSKSKREKKPQPPKGPKPTHLKDKHKETAEKSTSEAGAVGEEVGGEVSKTAEKVEKEVDEDVAELEDVKPEVDEVTELETAGPEEKAKEPKKEKADEPEKEKAEEPEKKTAEEPEKEKAKQPEKEKEDKEIVPDTAKAEKDDAKLMQKRLRANLEAALLSGTPPGSLPGSGRSSRRPSVNAAEASSRKSSTSTKAAAAEVATRKGSSAAESEPEEAPVTKREEAVVAKPKEKEKEKAPKKKGLFGWGSKKEKADKAKQLKEQAKLDKERAKLEEKQKKEQAKADARAAKEKSRSSKRERKQSDEKKAAAKAEAKAREEKDREKEKKKSAAEKMLAAQIGAVSGPKRPPGPRRPAGPKPTATKEQDTPPRKKSGGESDALNGVDTSSNQASKVSDYVSKINKLDPAKFGKFMMMPSLPTTPRHGTVSRKTGTGKNGTSSSRPSHRSSLKIPSRLERDGDDDTEDDTEDEGSDDEEPSRTNGVEIFDDDEDEEEEEKDVRSSSNFNKNLMFGQSVLAALLAKGPPPKAIDGPARLEGDGVDDGETGKSEIEHVVMARPTVGAKRKTRRPARRKKVNLEVDDFGMNF